MKFKYKGTKGGVAYEGEVEATDRFAVYKHVREEGGEVLSVEEEGSVQKNPSQWMEHINAAIGTVKTSEKIVFARNMAAMIEAGLSVSRALSVMERQTKNAKLKSVLRSLGESIKRGGTLHDALAKFPKVFSPLMVSMVAAGEESGGLAESLRVVAMQIERAYTLTRKIRGALIYPGIIVTAMIAIGILMLIFVVPTLASTFDELGAELPASTQAIITVSEFLSGNIVLVISGALLFALLLFAWGKTARGKHIIEVFILHLPIVGTLVKETNAARTSRTLSSLLSSGVDVLSAISITRDVLQNSHYKAVLTEAGEKVQKGEAISSVFAAHENVYPVLVAEMIAVGEETGKLSSLLLSLAEFYESEVEQKTKDMSTIIEPFLMIAVGVGVGFFAISMISPIYSLSSSI